MLTYKTFFQYLKERFPLEQFLALSLVFSMVASLATQKHLEEINTIYFFYSFFALLLFLFRLRLFDEFKDYEHDKKYYPDRPLSRGLLSLSDLKKIIYIVLFIEIIISLAYFPHSILAYIFALIYSLIMFREFFFSDWLKKHFTIYIISHEILLIPLFFYIFSLNGLNINNLTDQFFWWLLCFLGGQLFLLEIARKIRAKNDEIASRDTYTAQYGIWGASLLLFFISILIVISFAKINDGNYLIYVLLLWLILIIAMYKFIKNPIRKYAKTIFNSSIIFAMGCDLILIIDLLRHV